MTLNILKPALIWGLVFLLWITRNTTLPCCHSSVRLRADAGMTENKALFTKLDVYIFLFIFFLGMLYS